MKSEVRCPTMFAGWLHTEWPKRPWEECGPIHVNERIYTRRAHDSDSDESATYCTRLFFADWR